MGQYLKAKFSMTILLIFFAAGFAGGLCGCSTFSKSQSEQGKPEKDHKLSDRRLAADLTSGPIERPEVLIKRVVSNGTFGIAGECRILKGGWVEIDNGEQKTKKKIQSTLLDGKRPDSRSGNAQNKRQERSDWQLGKQYSEVELEGLIGKSLGGQLRILQESDAGREENYSVVEITSWGPIANGVHGAHIISKQDERGSLSVNDRLTQEQIDAITNLTKSICH
ncbi:MAG: hypothetical protein IPK04_21035 [Bdellovibrionales bacterium]|nr:hypothetical protein [Bdellovibrionales bacterium]